MRKKIQQLAGGKFDYNESELVLSTEKIELEVLEGRNEAGSFVITSQNHTKISGVVYSGNPRMECLTPQFEGEEARIRFQFHSEGLVEGDIQKGEFIIVCNQGEYNLSFVVSVSRLYADSAIGKIKNLNDFGKLAQQNGREAYRLFYSNNFKNLLKTEKELLLYEGVKSLPASEQKMEAFLIAVGKKQRAALFLPETHKQFYKVEGYLRQQIELQKTQWGALDVKITSDADFLVVEQKHLTAENFLGSSCILDYYIDAKKMHAGKNYGRIRFETPQSSDYYEVMADTKEKTEEKTVSTHRQIKIDRCRLLKLYMDYRLKRVVTGVWVQKSVEFLEHLSVLEPENGLWKLMKAQAFFTNRQRQEASWILSDYKREKISHPKPEWAYYLYLCTLMEREETYVNRVTEEIEQIAKEYPNDPVILWILLFVKEEYYSSESKRLLILSRWIENGNCSPFFYLEAYYLIWQDPCLLARLDSFGIKILGWAAKQNAISRELAAQVRSLLPEQREFDKKLFAILKKCYEADPSEEMTAAICSYLIRGQQFATKYHIWYERGIDCETRITNLYEAFLISMDPDAVTEIPKRIQLYFQYDSGLSYRYIAVLYVNIIAAKEKHPEMYQKYQNNMEQFAAAQMREGRMDDNLAVIYKEVLLNGILNEELAHRAADVLFIHKLVCINPKIATAYVWNWELTQPQIVPVNNGRAYFKAYSSHYTVLLCDTEGNCFAALQDYTDEALLEPMDYLKRCMLLAPDEPAYALCYFSKKREKKDFLNTDGQYFNMLMQSERVRNEYKAAILPEMIRFCQQKGDTAAMELYLSEAVPEGMSVENRTYMEEMLIKTEMYEKAYSWIQVSGYERLPGEQRVSLCSHEITEHNFEESDELLGLALTCFESGNFNDVILIYLCKFFEGSTRKMAAVWEAAGQFGIDTYDLEERILTQMLYSTDYISLIEKIYDSYCAGGGKEIVCMAYLSYFAHSYFVKDVMIPEQVFLQIEERYKKGMELNDICKLCLLKYLSEKENPGQEEKAIVITLLGMYMGEKRYFAFYKKFEAAVLRKYNLYDKFFVEFHSKPKQQVLLNYSEGDGIYRQEEMVEMYDGIYVKPFILLFGETVSYYISEKAQEQWKTVESGQIANEEGCVEENYSRYSAVNRILSAYAGHDKKMIAEAMTEYSQLEHQVNAIFKLL